MKILVLNGSPRKGNTVTAIKALVNGISAEHQTEVVDTYKLNVGPCKACDACGCQKGCVAKDDTNMIVDKIVDADVVVFATPVYWWGITAQMKIVVDKCYCKGSLLTNKTVGVIVVGGADTSDPQYDLIKKQFECIANYLSWNIIFHQSYSASEPTDLGKNQEALNELTAIGGNI